ncbi:MAG: hypothetical protein JWP57_3078, partial [Spirosoma sp.]|nr:hypothetical protein [Spirosoma sp.]
MGRPCGVYWNCDGENVIDPNGMKAATERKIIRWFHI